MQDDDSADRSPLAPSAAAACFPRRVHLLGAGGAGVSGVGRILAARGIALTGHDRAPSSMLDSLRDAGFDVAIGESAAADLPRDAQLVVRSAAVPKDDPQVLAALERGLPILKYAEALARLAPPARTLAVAGTHGKTTVAWMLWHALEGVGEECNAPVSGALIGGICRRMRTNALAGSDGGWFCVEACEYDRSFLHLAPFGTIVTNVEADHLDYYHTLEGVRRAFARFLSGTENDGVVVVGREVPEEVELEANGTVWRLGRELEVQLLGEEAGRFRFRVRGPGWASPPVALNVPGHFNVENAALAIALATSLGSTGAAALEPGVAAAAAARGIERFLGVERRFEPWGEVDGVQVVHDYAHHPTEVRVTVEAALRSFPERELHVLFQPHQHSRTARFLEEFADSLRAGDRVVVADVYGARLHIDERHAGAPELVLALERRGVDAVAGGPLDLAIEVFAASVPARAAALVLGAGDVERIRHELLEKLALRRAVPRTTRS